MENLNAEALAVIEKVKKLLALAQGNSNENEAASASAKAMELLAAYNLDMAVVGNTGKGSQRKDTRLKGGLYAWQRELWKAACGLNFCMYWSIKGLYKGSTYEHRVLGRHVNVVSAQNMADYLQQTVERLTRNYAKDRGYRSVFVRELIAYREGMARRLAERLIQIRKDRLADDERKKREEQARNKHRGASQSNALVLVSVIHSEEDYNTDYLNGWEPGTAAAKRAATAARRAAADAAYEAKMAERTAWELANPELAEAENRAVKEANEKWWAEYLTKEAKKNARRKNPVCRERAQSAQEQRASLYTFGAGYRKGEDIGLNEQMGDNSTKNKIGTR